MIRLSILALCLLTSDANAGPKLDAEGAVVENVYAREYLFTKQTAVHPIQLATGHWLILIPAKQNLAIVVASDFTASCIVESKSNVVEFAVLLSDSLNLIATQFLAFSLANEKSCIGFLWEKDGSYFGAAISEAGSATAARFVSQDGKVVEIQSVDASLSELSEEYLSAKTIRAFLNTTTPLGDVKRLSFQPRPQGLAVTARFLEKRDDHRYLRILDMEGTENIHKICSKEVIERRSAESSVRVRGILANLSETEVDIELVPYRNTVERTLDVAAYVICDGG